LEREIQMLKVLLIAAPLALSTVAFAGQTHFTDSQYVAASRCQALMSSQALGKVDTSAIDQLLKTEGGARSPAALDLADEARETAERAARHAGPYNKAQLVAERNGACQAYNGSGMVSASVHPSGATRTN
jgi:hypothetical protein